MVGVLGPLDVSINALQVRLTTGRLRTVLAVLAMSAGQPVSMERLAVAVWGDELPGNARRSLQTYGGRLRSALGERWLTTGPAGFVLDTDAENVDALRFVRILDLAARESDTERERRLLDEATGMWRGEPFAGVTSRWLGETEAPRLVERFLSGLERRIDLDLAAGRPGEVVAELNEWTARYPMRETLWTRLLTALDRCGRQAEALERYEQIRVRVAVELGVDPSPELQRVHADLLAGRTPGPAGGVRQPPRSTVVPRQLPVDIDTFTGRVAAVKALANLVGDPSESRPATIAVITGTAGVGKTALAVHWAHSVADRFAGGQLYVDLRGFGPSGEVTEPATAMRALLDALGVRPERIPGGLDAQVGLYRTLTADRAVLVILDNARDAGQVRPLLPAGSGCLVVVTSRAPLTGLVAAESAHPITLDVLSPAEARQLLVSRIGMNRAASDPAAVDDLIEMCARLPLALAIVAARVAIHQGLSLRALVADLRDSRSSLDAFDSGDPATDVRAVLSWSYHAISSEAAHLFRLLGLCRGPAFSASAAASLVAADVRRARDLLTELTRAHLVIERDTDRYTIHDLLLAYAGELAELHDSPAERRAAVHRLLDHYLHTAYRATRLLDPHLGPITPEDSQPAVTVDVLTDHDQALAWFVAEHPTLLAIVKQAEELQFDTHTWQVGWALTTFLDRQGHWHDWATTQRLALAAAQRLALPSEQARAHRTLARAFTRMQRFDAAHSHFTQALNLYVTLSDRLGLAITSLNLGWLEEKRGDYAGSLEHNDRALDLFQDLGHDVGRAKALNALGWLHAHRGSHHDALHYCRQALALHLDHDDRSGQAETWDSMGYIHRHLGHHQEAIASYESAVALHADLGDRFNQAGALVELGDIRRGAGELDAARDNYRRALDILEELGHPQADDVRSTLSQVG